MANDHVILNVHLQAAAGREEEAATQLQKLRRTDSQRAGLCAIPAPS